MIPLNDVIRPRTTPYAVYALVGAHLVIFIIESLLSTQHLADLVSSCGLAPGAHGVRTVLTAPWLHRSWIDLVGNIWVLWILGDNVEDRVGHLRFLGIYIGAAIAAGLAQLVLMPVASAPIIGAGGAIAGVTGAYFAMFPKSRIQVFVWLAVSIDIVEIPAIFLPAFWILAQLLGDVGALAGARGAAGLAISGYVMGFVAGVIGLVLLERKERRQIEWWG